MTLATATKQEILFYISETYVTLEWAVKENLPASYIREVVDLLAIYQAALKEAN